MKKLYLTLACLVPSLCFAAEDSLCAGFAGGSAAEAYFAEHMQAEYAADVGGEAVTFYGDYNGGSCASHALFWKGEDGEAHQGELNCPWNGCGMGRLLGFVEYEGKGYAIEQEHEFVNLLLERLLGWDKLSAEEQRQLRFRNRAQHLHRISSQNKKANLICAEDHYAYHERELTGNANCKDFDIDKIDSLIPIDDKQAGAAPLEVDLNRDGKPERLIRKNHFSSAGCGGDKYSLALAEGEGAGSFLNVLRNFFAATGWHERLYIVRHSRGTSKPVLERRVVVSGRTLTREIFHASDESITPICSFVNAAPVRWQH